MLSDSTIYVHFIKIYKKLGANKKVIPNSNLSPLTVILGNPKNVNQNDLNLIDFPGLTVEGEDEEEVLDKD